MALQKTGPIIFLLCFVTCIVCAISTEFEAGACHVEMTCDDGPKTASQGRPGKRGAPGEKGNRGERGPKGDPCQCTVQERDILDIKQLLKKQAEPKCIQTKYRFPRLAQTEDYIRLKTPISDMTDVSICFWITPKFSAKGTTSILSYALDGMDNALVLYFANQKLLHVFINGESREVNIAIGSKAHVCVIASTSQKWAKVYKDGKSTVTMGYSNSKSISGGGALFIGQEQDSFAGGLDATQAFSGTIENFMMWYQLLSTTEITALKNDACACPTDYAVGLRPEEIQLHGSVTAFPVQDC